MKTLKCLTTLIVLGLVMGCCVLPSQATVYYVDDAKANDSGSGLSWANAKKTIQAAIDVASDDDQVWVKAGLYLQFAGSMTLDKEGLEVYGGFEGDEVVLADRPGYPATDPQYTSYIDGLFYYSCVTVESDDTVIDGFTMSNGLGTLDDSVRYGAGIYCNGGSPTIRYNTIQFCWADLGGGIYAAYGTSPIVEHNDIRYNRANTGAGILAYHGIFDDNTITLNYPDTGDAYGGGIYLGSYDSAVTVSDNEITYNESKYGGGIYCLNTSDTTVIYDNNDISHHTLPDANESTAGGGIYCYNMNGTISGNVISDNDQLGFSGRSTGSHRLIATRGCFAHGVQRFLPGHQRCRLAVPAGATGREGHGNRCRGNVVRHLGNQNSIRRAERKVRVFDFAAQLLDGAAHRFKAVLRISDQPGKCFRSVTDLMKKIRHDGPP